MSPSPTPDTRARILEAAVAVFDREGLAGLTMRAVARQAEVAVGLANYHFGSRRALLQGVIDEIRGRYLAVFAQQLAPADGPQMLRQMLEMTRAILAFAPAWYTIIADLDAAALRDAELAAQTAAIKADGATVIGNYLQVVCDAFGAAATDTHALGSVLLAAFDGLALRSLIDPSFDHRDAFAQLEALLIAKLNPGAEPVRLPWLEHPIESLSRLPT